MRSRQRIRQKENRETVRASSAMRIKRALTPIEMSHVGPRTLAAFVDSLSGMGKKSWKRAPATLRPS
jgi:hypothetical protein